MTAEPDIRCPQHIEQAVPYPCSLCHDAAIAWSDWKRARDADEARRERAARTARMTDRARNIAACNECDDKGQRPDGYLCTHNPEQAEITRRGAAMARDALTGGN